VPAAPTSPWLAGCLASLDRPRGALFVVSEAAPSAPCVHVSVDPGAGFATRANRGLAAARSAGFGRALLLNDDTVTTSGAIEALDAAIDEPGVAAAGAVLVPWDGIGVQQAGIEVNPWTARGVGRTDDPGAATVERDAVSGAAIALDLCSWHELGGFDERFAFYFEDVDLCCRLRSRGARVVVVGAARIRHRGGGTQDGSTPDAARHLGRGHALLARKLGASRSGRVARVLCVGSLGAAWTVREVGLAGLPAFARGIAAGLRA